MTARREQTDGSSTAMSAVEVVALAERQRWGVGAFSLALRFVRRKPLGAIGVSIVLIMAILAIGAPVFARYGAEEVFSVANPNYDPNSLDPARLQRTRIAQLEGPSAKHWFGTDRVGRDIYSRVIWGARLSLMIGVGGMLIAVSGGSLVGMVSAYFGGKVDLLIQRIIDAIMSFPGILFLMLLVTVRESSLTWTVMALGFLGISSVSRVVRGSVLSVKQEMYVEAGRVIGASDLRLMVRYILPNIFAPIIVIFTISIGSFILAESSLSFLGLGVQEASWGKMVSDGRQFLIVSPWTSLFSGLAITLTVLGFNLAGDALRDILDPRLRGTR